MSQEQPADPSSHHQSGHRANKSRFVPNGPSSNVEASSWRCCDSPRTTRSPAYCPESRCRFQWQRRETGIARW